MPVELSERARLKNLVEKRDTLPRVKLVRFLAGRGFPIDLILDITGGVET